LTQSFCPQFGPEAVSVSNRKNKCQGYLLEGKDVLCVELKALRIHEPNVYKF